MLPPIRITVTTNAGNLVVPDAANSVTLQNTGLVDILLSVNESPSSANYFTLKSGDKLSNLSVNNTQILYYKTGALTSTLEIFWD